MKKKCCLFAFMFIVISLLTACGMKAPGISVLKNTAEKNAEKYIQDKYGINAVAKDSKTVKVDGLLLPQSTNLKYCTMRDEDGKEFHVLVNGDSSTIEVAGDDYMKEQIVADLKQIFYEADASKPESLDVYYSFNHGLDEWQDYMLSGTYEYSGNDSIEQKTHNLQELFEAEDKEQSITIYILASYIDDGKEKVDELKEKTLNILTQLPLSERTHLVSIKYRTKEDFENQKIISSPEQMIDDMDKLYFGYAPYICCVADNIPQFNSSKFEGYSFDMGHIDDFAYMIPNIPADNYSVNSESMSQPEADEYNGHGFIHAVPDGPKYSITFNTEDEVKGAIYIYRDKCDEPSEIVARYIFTKDDGTQKESFSKGYCNLYVEPGEYDFYNVYGLENKNYTFCFMKDKE